MNHDQINNDGSENIDEEISDEEMSGISGSKWGFGSFKPFAPRMGWLRNIRPSFQRNKKGIEPIDSSGIAEVKGRSNCTITSDTGVMGCPG
jgi:hypothetical protein